MSFPLEKIGAYARLLRLSNAPTAVADVWMGYAVVAGTLSPTAEVVLLSIASLCLYLGGMVGNDLADVLDDRAEGRDRPIATQAIAGLHAMRLRRGLEVIAVLLAALASLVVGFWLPVLVAVGLMATIRAYNSQLKKTSFGPWLMGLCRGLNVSLGMSAAGYATESLAVPAGMVFYIAGVTLFARDERQENARAPLLLGAVLSLTGVAWLAAWTCLSPNAPQLSSETGFYALWIVAAAFAVRGMAAAILQPTPRNIGRGVGIAIQGLIVIDATLAALYAGPMAGLAIFALLPVTMLLSKWIPQT